MRLMVQIGLVGIGSMLGGLTRWGVSVLAAHWLGRSYPWGTLIVNLLGCFFLGWIMNWLTRHPHFSAGGWIKPEELRLFFAVGFAGALTTFSTLEFEAHALMEEGKQGLGWIYIAASVFLGLLALRAGQWCGE